jgi:L-malate glycosyltransferase
VVVSDRLKILQLVTRRQYRGAEVFAAALSSSLAQLGHEIMYAGLYEPGENVLMANNAENIDLNGKKTMFDPALLFRLIKLIKRTKPDIVQANGSDTLKYAVMAKIFIPHLKIVYRNISMVSAWSKGNSLKRKFNQFLFKHVEWVTSVGQQPLNDLVSTYHFPIEKTRLIRRGISYFEFDRLEYRRKIASEFNFPASDHILVHIGRFSKEKNHPFLVSCFEGIIQEIPNTRLIFIGEGEELPRIREIVTNKKLIDKIFFAGHRSNVQEILAGSDVFLLGSTIEGVPGVILEAGIQSVPSVAVAVGGVDEVVINEQTGIIIQKHDAAAFSTAVVDLLRNCDKRTDLGKNARQFVIKNYSLQYCAHEFESLYREVL